MAKKFDLHQLLNERSRAAVQIQPQQESTPAESMTQLTLDVYDLIPSQENFYSTENIEDLKQSISLVGVLQPLLVVKEGDKYKLKAGHRRRLACMALVDEGQEQFRRVPCVIRQQTGEALGVSVNAILDRLTLILANGFREKTDWEKMEESLQTEALVLELRKEVKLEGRTRSILAKFTGIPEAQLGRYKAIKNNLCPQLMAEFKTDTIGVSTAYELSGLSSEYQDKAYTILHENGTLTITDAKNLKRQEEAAQQIPGQMEWRPENQAEYAPSTEYPEYPEIQEETQTKCPAVDTQDVPDESQTSETVQPEEHQDRNEASTTEVQQNIKKPQGCAFCHPDHHREVSTAEGGHLLAYEPESKTIQLLDKETGMVETFMFPRCPFCGRVLK